MRAFSKKCDLRVGNERINIGRRAVARVSVIAQTTGAADTVEQERLKLAAEELVVRVTRVRSENDQPSAYEVSVFPLARFPGLTSESRAIDDVFALAREHGLALGRATEDLDVVHATMDVAERLGIDPDESVLKLDRVVRSAEGLPVEWRIAFVVKP